MKKIGLFLGPQAYIGGTIQYKQTMLEAVCSLPKEEFQAVIVYGDDNWEERVKASGLYGIKVSQSFLGRAAGKISRLAGCPVKHWRAVSHWVDPIAKELLRQKCDLWIFPSPETWAYLTPVNAIVTIYDLMHRYEKRFPEVSEKGTYKSRENTYTQICSWAKGILADSEIGKQHIIESYGVDPGKVYVLPFVSSKHIYNTNSSNSFESRYQVPTRFIFYPAQFWEHKNHKFLIKAIKILKDKKIEVNLVLTGSKKNAFESTFEIVHELGVDNNIFYLGYIPDKDIVELYRRARGMIMPTFFGPTNIPPLEANALGCPVAVSKIYGMPEQLGDAAIYFNPSSAEDMANVIEKIWTDDLLCKKLKENGLIRDSKWNQFYFNKKLYEIITTNLK